jgi:molecular chaperone Hsp33
MNEHDRLIQGMAGNGDFRIVAAQTTRTVETAREILDLSPVATDALGRALTASLMLARLLEKHVRQQYMTLRFEGNGPIGVLIAEANISGSARGYVANAVPESEDATLDASRAIGEGRLTVIRGTGPNGRPYTSQVTLDGSSVAQELTRYLAQSEQIASAVVLGVMNRREGVAGAGGIIVQAFPHTSEEAIAALETRLKNAPPLSTLIEKMPIEDVVAQVLEGMDYKPLGIEVPLSYSCHCSRERALAPLVLFAPEELQQMIARGGSEVVCQFCGRKYDFSRDDLLALTAKHEA